MNLKWNNNISYPSVNINAFSYHSLSHFNGSLSKPPPTLFLSSLFRKREPTIFSNPSCSLVLVLPLSVATTTTTTTTTTVRYSMVHPDAAVLQDIGATALLLGGGYGLVSVFDRLTNRNLISKNLSRKLVHIISGLLFVAAWPLFSCTINARYLACLAPLLNGLRLVVHGLSLATDESLIKSVTREGRPEELLRGPLYYVLILALCAVLFWRESPTGLLAVTMMSGGDGIADIMGRKFGTVKIPYNQQKSWAGSISMFAFGFLISIGMLYYFSMLGYFQLDWNITVKRVAIVSFTATVVESLPITELIDDNISVPLVTMISSYICFCL